MSDSAVSPDLQARLLASYSPPAGAYDELRDPAGALRPAWSAAFSELARIGWDELGRREEAALRHLKENGATFSVHGDQGDERPWELDVMPLVLGLPEWNHLSAGLAQRARLFNVILADVLGPQRCLREGWLPPALVFDNPSFLFPCHGLRPPDGTLLHFYAADLARTPDGIWRVLQDLTQSPAGAGYVLENRIVLSRLMPELYRDCRVLRLARFFQSFRETLYRIAPRHRENPRIVLLSPGGRDDSYFEHAFLARYLGLTLVEAEDLAIRDNAVFMKMLGGLQSVDAIVRRLADADCDGLELPGGSGVPGLLNAARLGQVAVANTLGAGFLESPALRAFLPALCTGLLGETLQLPSQPTLWLGDPESWEQVRSERGRYRIQPAFGSGRPGTAMDEEALEEALKREPHRYAAQAISPFSCAPSLDEGRILARPVHLRAYAAATEDGFSAMPGGLARARDAEDPGGLMHLHRGGVSKDVWVLSDAPVVPFTLLSPAGAPIPLSRGGGDLPSRVADNLFWLGRYVERADYEIRIARVLLIRLSDRPDQAAMPRVAGLLQLLNDPQPSGELRFEQAVEEVYRILFDPVCAGGLRQTVEEVCRVARLSRDRIAADTWRILNRIDLSLESMERRRPGTAGDVIELLNRLIIRIAGVAGLSMESMTRGHGWRFLEMGRRIERAMQTILLVERMLVRCDDNEPQALDDLLQITDCAITYRRRYLASLQAAPVLDLLLTDDTNPRALAFQLASLAEEIDRLPRDTEQVGPSEEQKIALQLLTSVRLADIGHLAGHSVGGVRVALRDMVQAISESLPALSDTLARRYLSHAHSTRQLEAARTTGREESGPWGDTKGTAPP